MRLDTKCLDFSGDSAVGILVAEATPSTAEVVRDVGADESPGSRLVPLAHVHCLVDEQRLTVVTPASYRRLGGSGEQDPRAEGDRPGSTQPAAPAGYGAVAEAYRRKLPEMMFGQILPAGSQAHPSAAPRKRWKWWTPLSRATE